MRSVALLMVALGAAGGCGEDETVRRYRAPKDPSWRMLAAIIPAKDQTWFIKAVGSSVRLGAHKGEFLGFVRSVQVVEKDLKWTAPSGWKEERGSGDRQATLRVGSADPPLEATIVRLSGPAGGVLANVNRWREQLGLAPLAEADLARATTRIDVAGAQAIVVDFEGPRKPSGMAMGRPAPEVPRDEQGSRETVRAMFMFDVPSGWVENPEPGAGRVFELQAGEGKSVLVTLSILPEGAGGLTANVNRWRGQVGLEPVDDAGAERLVRPTEFLGGQGRYVELVGTEQAIVCAFTLGPPYSIFLKLTGPAVGVEREKSAFENFARTLKVRKHDGG